jgi:hypothetical protein
MRNLRLTNYWWYRYFLAPVFGIACFIFGATLLFVISAGHWRTTGWPTFRDDPDAQLEPSRIRLRSRVYFSADLAMAIGFVVMIMVVLTLLTLWWAGVFSRKI